MGLQSPTWVLAMPLMPPLLQEQASQKALLAVIIQSFSTLALVAVAHAAGIHRIQATVDD